MRPGTTLHPGLLLRAGVEPDAGTRARILDLQKTSGNSATSALLGGQIGLQRTNGGSTDKSMTLKALENALLGLERFKPELKAFAESVLLMESAALRYGFTLGLDDMRRSTAIPGEHRTLVEAGIELKNSRSYIREWVNELGKKGIKKLKKKQRGLLGIYLAAVDQYERVYRKEQEPYFTRQVSEGAIEPIPGAGDADVLPAATLIDHAIGPLRGTMRELSDPKHHLKPISKADVDELFEAYRMHTWDYLAQGAPSPEDLILGRSRGGVCGALAMALLEMIKVVAKARGVENPAYKNSHQGRFVTRHYNLGFIDPAVEGNIYEIADSRGSTRGFGEILRCTFVSHTWVEAFGTVYDPLSRQTGDFRDERFGIWDSRSDISTTGWLLEAVEDHRPAKGFSTGYRLRRPSQAEGLKDLRERARGIDLEDFKKRFGVK